MEMGESFFQNQGMGRCTLSISRRALSLIPNDNEATKTSNRKLKKDA
jgi:hypothetical protein